MSGKCCCSCLKRTSMSLESGPSLHSSFDTLAGTSKLEKVPYSADLPKNLGIGSGIYVSGVISPICSRFAINLTSGSDLALHFNPRLLQRYVVRNSLIQSRWGSEETTSSTRFPFARGCRFQLGFLISNGCFLIAVDGVHFCTYQFRVPWEKVNGIEVTGAIVVEQLEFKQMLTYPEDSRKLPCIKGQLGDGINLMETPATFLLPGLFRQNSQLEIYGRVKILPHSFYVNLQEGGNRWPHPNIPLHLNPRFGVSSGEIVFVRNSWLAGCWGQEECTPGFQFVPGSPFTMAIRRGSDHFSVWLDGKLAGEFKFRGDVDKIDVLHVEGDLLLLHVNFVL